MDVDVAGQLGATVREVRSRMHEGREARVVVAARSYATTIDDLWDAITSAERIPRWFLPISGDLRLGGRYQLQGNAGGTITGCEPPRRLQVTWEFAGAVSWVAVSLAEDPAGGTRLELEHMAYPDAHWEQFGPGAVGIGWDLTLMGLERHLASGGVQVDRQDAMAWMVSDQGKAFMRTSGEGWLAADLASGADAETARGAAGRTLAAYTGG